MYLFRMSAALSAGLALGLTADFCSPPKGAGSFGSRSFSAAGSGSGAGGGGGGAGALAPVVFGSGRRTEGVEETASSLAAAGSGVAGAGCCCGGE